MFTLFYIRAYVYVVRKYFRKYLRRYGSTFVPSKVRTFVAQKLTVDYSSFLGFLYKTIFSGFSRRIYVYRKAVNTKYCFNAGTIVG